MQALDVTLAWDAAAEVDANAVANGRRPPLLLRELLCAFDVAAHGTFLQRIPSRLLVRLVAARRWTAAQALAVARHYEPDLYVQSLVELAPYAPEALRDWALTEAHAVLDELSDVYQYACAVIQLARHQPTADSQRAFSDALAAVCDAPDVELRARTVAALAPYVPEGQRLRAVREAIADADAIEDNRVRADVALLLAPYLPEPDRVGALSDILAGESAVWDGCRFDTPPVAQSLAVAQPAFVGPRFAFGSVRYAQAVAMLARQLGEDERICAVRDALHAAMELDDVVESAVALAALAPYLPDAVGLPALGDTLDAASAAAAYADEYVGEATVEVLAPHLPDVLLADALSLATRNADNERSARAIAALAWRLSDVERERAIRDALAAVSGIRDAGGRAEAIAALLPHLPDSLLADALAASTAADSGLAHARALMELAPYLEERDCASALSLALAAAASTDDDVDRATVLMQIAPRLSASLMDDALNVAAMCSGYFRAVALTALASHSADDGRRRMLGDAVAATSTLTNPRDLASAMQALAPHLPDSERVIAFSTVLVAAAAARTPRADNQAMAMVAATHRFLEGEWARALSTASAPGSTMTTADSVTRPSAELASYRTEYDRELAVRGALDAANNFDDYNRAQAVAALTPYLSEHDRESALRDALAAISTTYLAYDREQVVRALAPQLPTALVPDAVSAAKAINEIITRASVLAALAPYLPDDLRAAALSETLAAASNYRDLRIRARVVAALAPYLSNDDRECALRDVVTAEPMPDPYEQADAVMALASHLTSDERERALSEMLIAMISKEARFREATMADLLRRFSDVLSPDALIAATTIPSLRVQAVAALAPHLSQDERVDVLNQVLDESCAIANAVDRARAVASLAAQLPDASATKLLARGSGNSKRPLNKDRPR